ncbi:hypothetical protein FQZ97_967170 [compost metagenome]
MLAEVELDVGGHKGIRPGEAVEGGPDQLAYGAARAICADQPVCFDHMLAMGVPDGGEHLLIVLFDGLELRAPFHLGTWKCE